MRLKQLFKRITLTMYVGGTLSFGVAQELPPITNYPPTTYRADNQNWQASQDDSGVIYIANNKGLLSFNGAQWHLNPSPNETIIRSVRAIDDRIYTGAHMDFGYWEAQENGVLAYTSLKETLDIQMLEGEQIWKILPYNNKVILQSLNGMYIYNAQQETVDYILVDSQNTLYRIFEIDGALYFQVAGSGLFTIKNGEAVLYNDHPIFKSKIFTTLFKRATGWLGVTQKDGIYTINDAQIKPWEHEASPLMKTVTVYRSLQLSDGGIAIGTVANGFIKLTKQGALDYQYTQDVGLGNNTVLSLFEDRGKNIWIGLDNGVACVNTELPISNFVDPQGRLGTTYASVLHNEALYLGTNQGLFYRAKEASDFRLVPGTEEQVWTLRVIDGELFCGHTKGTFLLTDGFQTQIATIPGTWDIKKIPKRPDLLLQGNYDGLYVLQNIDGQWSLRNKIAGFDVSSRHFEFVEDHKILIGNEYKGVYEVVVDTAFAKAETQSLNPSVTKGEHSSLETFDDIVFYANREGIYRYIPDTSLFEKDNSLSALLTNKFISGKLVNDDHGKLWAFTENELIHFTKDPLEYNFSVGRIQIPQALRNTAKGFENITAIAPNNYLIGTTNGYLKVEGALDERVYQITLNKVESKKRNGTSALVSLKAQGDFDSEDNSVSFAYHVAEFDKYQQADYQHRLLGFYDTWSPWEPKATHEYANVPSGDYTFEVRARVGDALTTNTATYSFSIGKPWYASYAALVAYVLLGVLLFLVLNAYNKRRYRIRQDQLLEKTKQEMDLKALAVEKENVELRNENLRNDIEARNRELAASTMAMVNKSKTLNKIKDKLTKLEPSKELKEVIAAIDKNISTNEDWSFFEKAFNQADKNFFKKVKARHPQLTANDLKLCVYLRLNMSSKEIAPLLNISHRSVEIKRYRLRKKINLDREVQLNEYFMNL